MEKMKFIIVILTKKNLFFYLNINLIDRYMPVFLCINNNITNFDCYQFKSYIEADKYYSDNYNNNINSTMLFIYNLWPLFIQKIILDYKLKNIFVNKIRFKDIH